MSDLLLYSLSLNYLLSYCWPNYLYSSLFIIDHAALYCNECILWSEGYRQATHDQYRMGTLEVVRVQGTQDCVVSNLCNSWTVQRPAQKDAGKVCSRDRVCQEPSKYLGQLFVANQVALNCIRRDSRGRISGAEGRASINAWVFCLR